MRTIFRPVEFWKSAVMTMPDNSFFELLRSVFGKIKTPFNKQQLLKDLEIFLLRDDIQKTIAGYIDENDSKIIAAVALFGEPVPSDLETFFSGELSYTRLMDIIVNLEERFILYRFSEENTSRIALNPVLEQILAPVAANISSLFPVAEEDSANTGSETNSRKQTAVLNDRILAALLSFASQWDSFYRTESVIRKQVIEAGKNCFPGIEMESVVGGLQALGLFYVEAEKLVPDRKRFDDFALLSARERSEYCSAALFAYNENYLNKTNDQEGILPPLFKNRIREIVNFIHGFLDMSVSTQSILTEKTLKRLAEILKARTEIKLNTDKLLEALERTGLIVTMSGNLKQAGFNLKNEAEKNSGQVIAIDSSSSIIVYPEINFSDAISIAGFANIRETTAASGIVCFEIEKDSAVRAFDRNTGADEIVNLLMKLSGGKVDNALVWNLKEWEKRHGEISLKKGIVLTLAQDKRYLTETVPLCEMIVETLAPGVYLLNENAMESASAALQNAGIDIIARRANKKETGVSTHNNFPPPSSNSISEKITVTKKSSVPETDNALTAEFHEILKNMPLGKTEHDELSARIDRRLVLCEAQLKTADIRYEKLEARNMDYAGKQNIAKQAVALQSPVEIIFLGAGKENRIFGIPESLEKENGELFFAIIPDGEKEVIRLPLAKLSLIRRIKKSIFEN
jgi:hypothetical protein